MVTHDLTLERVTDAVVAGYATFFPNMTDYDLSNSPRSWALVPAMRHAMATFPHSTYFVSLSPHSLIMNPSLSIKNHIMDRKRLESIMMRDKPVVPPDSVIRTFSHLRGDKIDFVITQDAEGLCQGSFIMRRGEWAKFFLDTWFDPLYRSYNFQKAEGHALVQRHPNPLLLHVQSTNSICGSGTYRPMASHDLDEARLGSAKNHQCLQQRYALTWWTGRRIRGRRFHCPSRRLRAGSISELPERIRDLLCRVEKVDIEALMIHT